jgi:eukaryotic-like serine/threonine-protein kinase
MIEVRAIGKYQITGLLGTGGQGQVHAAVDPELGREVAIKSLHRLGGAATDSENRFRSEAKSLARIIHSNITTLIDFFPLDDHLYMIMELVHGRTLEDILRDRGKGLGVWESLAIMAQAADGLAYAHQMGVIHRDIKPSNLMITGSGRVKIMDFGIARIQGSDRLTRTGSAIGTPLYMSPEQCMGADGDERSDIYSLAIVLYEMLSGAPPFQGKTDHQLAEAHIRTQPAPLIPHVAGVTPALEFAIMKALSKKPEQRFNSMRAFSDALGAHALLGDSADIIKSHRNLTQGSTADHDPADARGLTGTIIAVARSRAATLVRRFNAWHPALKGASIGFVAIFLSVGAYLWWAGLQPCCAPPDPPIACCAIHQDLPIPLPSPIRVPPQPVSDPCATKSASFVPPPGTDCASDGDRSDDRTAPISKDEATQHDSPASSVSRAAAVMLAPQAATVVSSRSIAVSPPPEPAPTLADLRQAHANYNYVREFEIAKKLAHFKQDGDGGDPEAEYSLGTIFLNGYAGATKNLEQAIHWYQKAASQGNNMAVFEIGGIYWKGGDNLQPHDCSAALPWIRQAAEAGISKAEYTLGVLYDNNYCNLAASKSQARREAKYYFKLAADHGDEQARAWLSAQ